MRPINDNQMLQYISKTAEMGVTGINEVLPFATDEHFKKQLMDQQKEYGEMYTKARTMLRRRGKEPKHISRIAKWNAKMSVKANTIIDRSPSKIAEMMIQGNTMGLTKSIQHFHQYQGNNHQVRTLAAQLLRTEKSNIDAMKPFL